MAKAKIRDSVLAKAQVEGGMEKMRAVFEGACRGAGGDRRKIAEALEIGRDHVSHWARKLGVDIDALVGRPDSDTTTSIPS